MERIFLISIVYNTVSRFALSKFGDWLPKSGTPEDAEKLKFVSFLVGQATDEQL